MNATVVKPSLRLFHRTSAVLLSSFALIHIANHVVGLAGQAEHIAFMQAMRPYYRNAIVEPVLLVLFALQATTGTTLAVKGWHQRRGFVAWAQTISGLNLAAFLLIHIISVMIGRGVLGLDTDFRFAAAGFHVAGWPWYFAPYYFFAVFALFVHVGCALYWHFDMRARHYARFALWSMMALGTTLALAFVASLAGLLHPVNIPQRYLMTY